MRTLEIASLFDQGAIRVPWPTHVGGKTIPGDLGVNRICETKCTLHPCWHEASSSIGTACYLGLTVYEVPIGAEKVKIFGVVSPGLKERLPNHPEYKSACKGRSVSPADIQSWADSVRKLLEEFDELQKNALAIALEPLHDAMRLARDIAQLADRTISEIDGASATERFENASPTHKALVKSATLLVDTFDLLEIYLNPNAAKFGQPRSVEIYKLVDKLCRIASIARATQVRPRVRIEGSTRRSFDLYESFKLIPFCLIDNAQKYSRQGAEVTVRVNEEPAGVLVDVESEGPYIEPADQKNIFTRGYRGEAAKAAHPSGMGVGLFVSDIVARAHGTRILVSSQKLGFQIGGIDQAKNRFTFQVKSVSSRR